MPQLYRRCPCLATTHVYSLLYMRAAPADLAAPARIRLAAVDLFGRHGFDLGLRAIAEEAGVSLGLIRHHFGSKDGLRQACDDYVLGELRRMQDEQSLVEDPARSLLEQLAGVDDHQPLVLYLVRALGTGGELAHALWERMVADTEEYLAKGVDTGLVRPSRDPAGRARLLAMTELGGLMLMRSLARDEDFGTTWRRYVDQVTLPALELYTQGLLTTGSMLDEYLAYRKEQS